MIKKKLIVVCVLSLLAEIFIIFLIGVVNKTKCKSTEGVQYNSGVVNKGGEEYCEFLMDDAIYYYFGTNKKKK